MITLDVNVLVSIAGPPISRAQSANMAGWAPVLSTYLEKYEVTTLLRIEHFLSQCAEECDRWQTFTEYATGGAYEGRVDLGNIQPGDGVRFRGRGGIMMTGRANYKRIGDALGIDLVNHPERAAEPAVALLVSLEFWKQNNLNAIADRDDVLGVTKKVNGGTNGLADRKTFLARAKVAVPAFASKKIGQPMSSDTPTLHRGMTNSEVVGKLQEMLSFLGWPVAIDQDFGPGTETAVKAVQMIAKLEPDGVVGPLTWAAIKNLVLARTGAKGAAKG